MDLGVISVRYARALLKGALAEKQEDKLYKDMQILLQSYIEVPELRITIDNPMLPTDKKQAVLEAACGKLITATAVTQEVETKMKQMVENRTQGSVEFNAEVDEGLIGGFILEYDDCRMDASVKGKLRSILSELKK